MLRTYLAAGAIVAAEAAMAAFAMSPDVDPVYRSVFIDRETACYPVEVSGEYQLGTTLSFGPDQGSLRRSIARCGLRDPDRVWNGSWSDGERTVFYFADISSQHREDLSLDVVMWPFIAEGISSQRVAVSANGTPVADLILEAEAPPFHTVSIPGGLVDASGSPLEITFGYPDAISPRALDIGSDRFAYAVFFRSLRLRIAYRPPK